MIKTYKATKKESLKDFLLSNTDISNNMITKISGGNGQFIVNDMNVTSIYKLKENDIIQVVFPESRNTNSIQSIKGDFEIIYEDSYLLIINKKNNVACIPTKKYFNNSLANFVLSYYLQNNIISNIHFVNRLDVPTSGLIILAKNPYVTELMEKTKIIKKYLLEVKGILDIKQGCIKTGIKKESENSTKRCVTKEFTNSETLYEVIKEDNDKSLILATLKTGKTHQLRVHFSYLNHPIIGDELYGIKEKDNILHLHSYYLEFKHPITKQLIILKTIPSWLNIK